MKAMRAVSIGRVAAAAILVFTVLLPFSVSTTTSEDRAQYDIIGIGYQINNWLAEHAEIRKQISRMLKFRLTHQSPSDSLAIGRSGWIFYTLGNNLDIPRGTFPLTQEQLDFQAEAFSNLKKYYAILGADFYFLPYPSKTSIYPEYIEGEKLTVGVTPVDIAANNLTDRTDVNVIAPKQQILADKALGKTYMKMDVHTSDLGAYATYKTICRDISAKSGINIIPVPVEFADGEYSIGANSIAGVKGLFGESETGPVAQYEAKAKRIIEGDFYDRISAITASDAYSAAMSDWAIFENPDAAGGTLLVYGTSMWLYDNLGERYQLTRYLAENFKRVVYIGKNYSIAPAIDSAVEPDIVIAELPERYLNIAEARTGAIPAVAAAEDYSTIAQISQVGKLGKAGMWLDRFGTQILHTDTSCELGKQDSIILSGWAVDENTQLPLSELYLKIGDNTFKCSYGLNRPNASKTFGYTQAADQCGFSIEIPRRLFNGVKEIQFIPIGTDGSYRYMPISYDVK